MFYSQFILAKKGPLGTIWIAAHLERKLRKNQVADTDIGVSVDSILFPEAPIALRLSSHLLLGVVRIYSKKVNYLFDDCSDALLKVKQAFRSTAVDLPPEESTAPYHSITLPETLVLDDFEIPEADILRGNYVDHHVSTKDQITLQENREGAGLSTFKFGLDERFGDGDTSHVLDFEEDLLLGKITSQFDEIAEIDSNVSNRSESKVPDDEAQAPSTPGLVSEPNIVTAQNATSEEHNYILEENDGVEIMNVDSDLKLPEDSDCVLRHCTSFPTENDPSPELVLVPETEPVTSFSESEVEPVKPLSDPEVETVIPLTDSQGELVMPISDPDGEPVKPLSDPEVEPAKSLSEPEVLPVNSLSETEAEPVKSLSDPEVGPVELLSSSGTESSDSLFEPETEPVKSRTRSADSPLSLVGKTTPKTVSGRSKSAKRKILKRLGSVDTPKDDDLLSTILGGRRSSILSKRTASQEMSSRKRTKSTPRVSTVKRKVLVDDSMGLLGDTIRNQLKSTADIRRLRKKAPCTTAEVMAAERLLIDDEIFCEAVFSGTASDLSRLHFDNFDLSAVQMEDIHRDEVPDRNENQEGEEDKILEVVYHEDERGDNAIFDVVVGKSDNPKKTIAISVHDECGAAGDLDSSANEVPALSVCKEYGGEERASIDEPNEESAIPERPQVEETGDSSAPFDEPNAESSNPGPRQGDELGVGELNEELAIPEPHVVQETGIAMDGVRASFKDDVIEEHNRDKLEKNFIASNTEFLSIDEDDNGEDDAEDGEPLDNSGWSSRTRAVASYLQQLFVNETNNEKNALSVDALLRGKSSKEASRMFFETLVLKSKDYIQVEQGNPYDHINIEPRLRLMKSDF